MYCCVKLWVDCVLWQSKGFVVFVGEGGIGKSLFVCFIFEEFEEEMFELLFMVMM